MNKFFKPIIKPDKSERKNYMGLDASGTSQVNLWYMCWTAHWAISDFHVTSRAGLVTNILFLSHPGIILPSSKQLWAERPSSVIILASSCQVGWLILPS